MSIRFGSDIWGVDEGTSFSCLYQESSAITGINTTQINFSFLANSSGDVQNTGGGGNSSRQTVIDTVLSGSNGGFADCPSFVGAGSIQYSLLSVDTATQGTGIFEARDFAFGAFIVGILLIIFYAAWRHMKRALEAISGEWQDDRPDGLEIYYDEAGNERFRTHPLARWRMDQ